MLNLLIIGGSMDHILHKRMLRSKHKEGNAEESVRPCRECRNCNCRSMKNGSAFRAMKMGARSFHKGKVSLQLMS